MQDLWLFHHWLAGGVRTDFPNLHVLALVAGQFEWRAGNYLLEKLLTEKFPADLVKKQLELIRFRRELHQSDSIAHHLFHFHRPDGGSPSAGIAEVNLHQAQLMHCENSPHHPKATLAHEIGHIAGFYKTPDYAPWTTLHEEVAADLFETGVMAAHGVAGHHDHILFRRLRSRFNDAVLYLQRDYAYPAVAAEAAALARRCAVAGPAGLSVRALRTEAEEIVWRNHGRLEQWRRFTEAAHKAGATHSRAGIDVLRELRAAEPLAADIETLAGLDPATAGRTAPPGQGWRAQIHKAYKVAVCETRLGGDYYIAMNDRIVDGIWPKRDIAIAAGPR